MNRLAFMPMYGALVALAGLLGLVTLWVSNDLASPGISLRSAVPTFMVMTIVVAPACMLLDSGRRTLGALISGAANAVAVCIPVQVISTSDAPDVAVAAVGFACWIVGNLVLVMTLTRGRSMPDGQFEVVDASVRGRRSWRWMLLGGTVVAAFAMAYVLITIWPVFDLVFDVIDFVVDGPHGD